MVKMPAEVIEFVRANRPALVATVSPDGAPNVAPKGSLTVLDEEHLVFADLVAGRTSNNILMDPRVAVLVLSPDGRGYQIRGRGRFEHGGALFARSCEAISGLRISLPPPRAVVVIEAENIDEIAPPRMPG